ncbi:vomeronasal type-2 receptor 1-like [Pyxicephalus adspersus]|uniref:vomeronasal type-2 receptor 1-like n=1 Tax=Pyxicephalus adspersus TaxID=30357 RepID=UPI003B599D8A
MLSEPKLDGYYKEGDFIVGGIIQVTRDYFVRYSKFIKKPRPIPCGLLSFYIQISYGPMTSVLTDIHQFPTFYQVLPLELSAVDVIVNLLKHFGWKWVGLLTSDDETGHRAGDILRNEISNYGGCVAFSIEVYDDLTMLRQRAEIIKKINSSSANVIVSFLHVNFAQAFVKAFFYPKLLNKFWIMSLFFSDVPKIRSHNIIYTFNGSLVVLLQQGLIPGFKQHFYTLKPADFPNDVNFHSVFGRLASCTFTHRTDNILPMCTGNETLDEEFLALFDFFTFRTSYGVYTATYALAHSLQDMMTYTKGPEMFLTYFKQWKVGYTD